MSISFHTDEITEVIQGPHLDGPGLFADRIAAEFAYSLRHGVPLTLIVIEPRHVAEVLAASHPVWRESVRESDVVARIDKRRIAVIAPRTPTQMAMELVERLRASVQGAMRIGLVTQTPSNTFDGPGAMLRAAELALA